MISVIRFEVESLFMNRDSNNEYKWRNYFAVNKYFQSYLLNGVLSVEQWAYWWALNSSQCQCE